MTRPADNTAEQCPVCGTPEIDLEASVCSNCGAPIASGSAAGASASGPLMAGDRVGGAYVIDGVRWIWPDVVYYNARSEANPSERVLLAERTASAPDPLADAGLNKPGDTSYLSTIRSRPSTRCSAGSTTPES